MRIAYTGLIFRKVSRHDDHRSERDCTPFKVLRLSSRATSDFSSGEVVNLVANDAQTVEVAHYFFNYLWVGHAKDHSVRSSVDSLSLGCTIADRRRRLPPLAFRSIRRVHRDRVHALAATDPAAVQPAVYSSAVRRGTEMRRTVRVFSSTQILKVTDERVKAMSEIIKSMRIVKMYCWEAGFEAQIRRTRK